MLTVRIIQELVILKISAKTNNNRLNSSTKNKEHKKEDKILESNKTLKNSNKVPKIFKKDQLLIDHPNNLFKIIKSS